MNVAAAEEEESMGAKDVLQTLLMDLSPAFGSPHILSLFLPCVSFSLFLVADITFGFLEG